MVELMIAARIVFWYSFTKTVGVFHIKSFKRARWSLSSIHQHHNVWFRFWRNSMNLASFDKKKIPCWTNIFKEFGHHALTKWSKFSYKNNLETYLVKFLFNWFASQFPVEVYFININVSFLWFQRIEFITSQRTNYQDLFAELCCPLPCHVLPICCWGSMVCKATKRCQRYMPVVQQHSGGVYARNWLGCSHTTLQSIINDWIFTTFKDFSFSYFVSIMFTDWIFLPLLWCLFFCLCCLPPCLFTAPSRMVHLF